MDERSLSADSASLWICSMKCYISSSQPGEFPEKYPPRSFVFCRKYGTKNRRFRLL